MQPIIEQVNKSAAKVKETTETVEERNEVDNTVREMTKRWEAFVRRVKERRDDIDKLLPTTFDDDTCLEEFRPHLKKVEDSVKEFQEVPTTIQDCQKQMEGLQVNIL